MFVLRHQPKGARIASFGIGLCVFAWMPTEIGYQDIASLLARQPGVAERWQKRVFSAASSIQLATYSFGRPMGTAAPQSANYRLAGLGCPGQPAYSLHFAARQSPSGGRNCKWRAGLSWRRRILAFASAQPRLAGGPARTRYPDIRSLSASMRRRRDQFRRT